jgi:alpha-D-ribose 1-methylphosphonate 5-triphosphate diphosphatase PhnM
MASVRPAAFLELPDRELTPGNPADLVTFDLIDGTVRIRQVIKAGETVVGHGSGAWNV